MVSVGWEEGEKTELPQAKSSIQMRLQQARQSELTRRLLLSAVGRREVSGRAPQRERGESGREGDSLVLRPLGQSCATFEPRYWHKRTQAGCKVADSCFISS